MKQAAIFDIDKTIVNGNTGRHHVWNLFITGKIGPSRALRINYYVLRYLLRTIDYEKAMDGAYMASSGWQVSDVRKRISRYYEKKVHHLIYDHMRRIISEHRKKGRVIIFATNSWEAMVKDIAEELKPDYLLATDISIKDGRYTGVVARPCFGRYKRQYIEKIARKDSLDLKNSYAYSDHISDLPMLEAVGNPVAVSPDKRLLAVAKERRWKVMYPDKGSNI